MIGNPDTKVVLEKTALHGPSQTEVLQRVATVYIEGREYRVSAPPGARGDALDWVPHFNVRQLVEPNSEVEVRGALGVLALKAVKEELEKQKRDANRAQGIDFVGRLTSPQPSNSGPGKPVLETKTGTTERAPSSLNIEIFISHSSADAGIALELLDLFRLAIPDLRPEVIRCTSVPGYRLEGGAKTDEELLKELLGARVFIGLLSKQSLHSTYVLFELGARWGAGKHLIPLVVAGMTASELGAPLSGLNAHSAAIDSHLFQLVGEVASKLGLPLAKPPVYEAHIRKLVHTSDEEGKRRNGIPSANVTTPSPQPISSESPGPPSTTTQRDLLADLISELEDNLNCARTPRIGDAYDRPSSQVWRSIRNKIKLPDRLRSHLSITYRQIDSWLTVVESGVHPNIGSPDLNVTTNGLRNELPILIEELKKIL
jgi:hypothetical protein